MLVAAALASGPARADLDWEYTPVIATDFIHESNPDSIPQDSTEQEDDAYIGTLSASVSFSGRSQRWRNEFEPRVVMRESWGNESNRQLDGTDFSLRGSSRWGTERQSAAVNGLFSRTPSRESDYQVANPNTAQIAGSGLGCTPEIAVDNRCTVDEYQDRFYIGPEFFWLLNERLTLNADTSYESTRYSEAAITGRIDYDVYRASASLTRTLTDRQQISGTANFTAFTSEQPVSAIPEDETYRLESRSYTPGFQLGYLYRFSPELTLSANAGASFSHVRYTGLLTVDGLPCFDPDRGGDANDDGEPDGAFVACSRRSKSSNFVGNVLLRRKLGEMISGQLSAGREVQPGGDGAQVVTDSLSAYLDNEFTEKLSGSIGAFYSSQSALDERAERIYRRRFDRDYTRLELDVRWQFLRDWTLQAQVNYYLDEQKAQFEGGLAAVDIENTIALLRLQYGRTFKLNGF